MVPLPLAPGLLEAEIEEGTCCVSGDYNQTLETATAIPAAHIWTNNEGKWLHLYTAYI